MNVKYPGKHATKSEPWRLNHGSYKYEIKTTLNTIKGADRVFSDWYELRVLADYNPKQICHKEIWKQSKVQLRKAAHEVAEAIYEKLSK